MEYMIPSHNIKIFLVVMKSFGGKLWEAFKPILLSRRGRNRKFKNAVNLHYATQNHISEDVNH
jgi:hypothetical protein